MLTKFTSLLFSRKTTLVLLLLFAISIGTATFVEQKYDTATAQILIYKAWWFELMLLLLALNFVGNIKRYNLFNRERFGTLLFHLGFILAILGAGITRYTGYEGTMHIRQNEKSNYFMSSNLFLQANVVSKKEQFNNERELLLSNVLDNNFSLKVESGDNDPVKIKYKRYLKNAEEFVNEGMEDGQDMLALKISSQGSSQGVYLKKGEKVSIEGVMISFEDSLHKQDIYIEEDSGKLIINAARPIAGMFMGGGFPDTTQRGMRVELRPKNLFEYQPIMFAMVNYYRKAQLEFKPAEDSEEGIEVLSLDVEHSGEKHHINLTGLSGVNDQPQLLKFKNLDVNLKYGPKKINLPFDIRLNKFILDRYPGSMSPSSFASEVTVLDSTNNKNFDKRIFMNHVLDYRGFRFFQSSYDRDEQGTVLAVNHDLPGTIVSYISYLILLIGFVITLLQKRSRFSILSKAMKAIREKRKAMITLLFLSIFSFQLSAQENDSHVVPLEEADKFGAVLVQTFDGRVEPLHTLAYDLLHKISKKDNYKSRVKGTLDPMQVMIDVIVDPEYWKKQKLIFVKENSVADMLDITDGYASFNDFIGSNGMYKLSDQLEKSFRKSQAKQNKFDKELIKVDERVNLFYSMLQGSELRIFPFEQYSNKWIAWNDSLAFLPITGQLTSINNDLKLANFNFNNIQKTYLQSILSGVHSDDYSKADNMIEYFRKIQANCKDANRFPSASMIQMEINYNKSSIFKNITILYLIISLLLAVFAFIENFQVKPAKWVKLGLTISLGLLAAIFLYHTYGMILRWYLSGHAPWSNGYEALLMVAWTAVLAGFINMRNSKIVQAATAFLAFMILMTANISSYDPQLGNLVPVLQSYWLVIHVAVITSSYGFLALSFILGMTNMGLYLFKTDKNRSNLNLLITELTIINEKNMQIGLFLATIGTFLGGVWASESWGRYWGWDAKETWALVIVIVYSFILHLQLVPKFKNRFIFNVATILGFSAVLMTFFGVNYYLSKGLHSYAADEKTVFPVWAWISIAAVFALISLSALKEKKIEKQVGKNTEEAIEEI